MVATHLLYLGVQLCLSPGNTACGLGQGLEYMEVYRWARQEVLGLEVSGLRLCDWRSSYGLLGKAFKVP